MATLTGLIPVTVGTFEVYHGGGGGDTIGGREGGGLGTQSAGPYMHACLSVYWGDVYGDTSVCCLGFTIVGCRILDFGACLS